jgi:riboflavin kinase/FMN adenylyltransferase
MPAPVTRSAVPVAIDENSPVSDGACAMVVGNFDGVHRGHQAVLSEAVVEARASGLVAAVLTFDPHPAAIVGAGAPPRLSTIERRAELMSALGVDRVYVRKFDAAFAGWSPERFVRELVVHTLHARVVVVGQNFRFGAKRAGDLTLLRALGQQIGFGVGVHQVASDARGPFSSTRAREAIAVADLDEACRVLGRTHELSGVVVRGDARGRALGFPTANLDKVLEMLPPDGVYAVTVDEVTGPGLTRPLGVGVTNIGVRPTITTGDAKRTVETFLLDFDEDLYGRRLRLHLSARLRDEKRFGSLDELKAQIALDVASARLKLAPSRSPEP